MKLVLWDESLQKLLMSAIYLFYALKLVGFLLHNWHTMNDTIRSEALSVVVFSGVLWLQLLRDKASRSCA